MIGFRSRPLWVGVVLIIFLAVLPSNAIALSEKAGSIPTQWPSSQGLSPGLEAWPNAIRLWGPTRYETGLAVGLAMRGRGGFPFTTADPSSDGALALSSASGWWGKSQCPRSVIVVAGDSPADALAASVLSDPTGFSSEPYLRRVAAADPLFYPIGGYGRVDTDLAPVVITRAARAGYNKLTVASRFGLQDLRSGGCRSARQAIIVGGDRAVHPDVETELVSMGYDEVYRVAGENRFATAAAVAVSLGTSAIPAGTIGCADQSSIDGDSRMSFYANSVIEWRPTASECTLLGNTVVLTDGISGADALAAGWWTSFWQVPVLLHNGRDSLPAETFTALQTLEVENVIVLGGKARISDAAAAEAATASGGNIVRISGADRYATSFETAQQFGGWWPTGRGEDFEGSVLCVAASAGPGSRSEGWADALSAGAWCGSASNVSPPARALAPANGGRPDLVTHGLKATHDAVPLVLVPAGAETLPVTITAAIRKYFSPQSTWCSSQLEVAGCSMPGFIVVFGGSKVVSDGVVAELSSLMSGGPIPAASRTNPRVSDAYATSLSQVPVYRNAGVGSVKICMPRDSYSDARWLIAGKDANLRVLSSVDLMFDDWYNLDGDGRQRSKGVGAPGCLNIDAIAGDQIWVRSVGLDGQVSTMRRFTISPSPVFSMVGSIFSLPPSHATGIDSSLDPDDGGVTTWNFASVAPPVAISLGSGNVPVTTTSIFVELARGVGQGGANADTFSAFWDLTTPDGRISGDAQGEAILEGGVWFLRGWTSFDSSELLTDQGSGGFSSEIGLNAAGFGDDWISWSIDLIAKD